MGAIIWGSFLFKMSNNWTSLKASHLSTQKITLLDIFLFFFSEIFSHLLYLQGQGQANQQYGFNPQVSSATPPPTAGGTGGPNPYARGPGSYGGGYPRPAANYPQHNIWSGWDQQWQNPTPKL